MVDEFEKVAGFHVCHFLVFYCKEMEKTEFQSEVYKNTYIQFYDLIQNLELD